MPAAILDVGGLHIGQAHDARVKTGVTVILPDAPATCAVDVRGGGPGTRETDTLADGGLIEQVHAICLAGGSVYGLAAADGVCAWLGHKGIGYSARESIPPSPIVPRGLYPGGLGSASETVNGVTVGAIIAANPVGSPYMPGTDCPWAWPYEVGGEFGAKRPPADYKYADAQDTKLAFLKAAGQSTVIGAVAIDAALTQKQLKRIAIMAQDGIAMAVQPSHTPLDGDTIFALSTGQKTCSSPVELADLGAAAARCVARALMRGVYQASK